MKTERSWTHYITDNFSYKVVALFISLILWLTILGRHEPKNTRRIGVEFQTAPGQMVVAQNTDTVLVKVSGSRAAVKKFMDNPRAESIVIDVSDRGDGILEVEIPPNKIEVPNGVRIVFIRPNVIRAEIANKKE